MEKLLKILLPRINLFLAFVFWIVAIAYIIGSIILCGIYFYQVFIEVNSNSNIGIDPFLSSIYVLFFLLISFVPLRNSLYGYMSVIMFKNDPLHNAHQNKLHRLSLTAYFSSNIFLFLAIINIGFILSGNNVFYNIKPQQYYFYVAENTFPVIVLCYVFSAFLFYHYKQKIKSNPLGV